MTVVITRGAPARDGDDGHGNPIYRVPLSDYPDEEWSSVFDGASFNSSLNVPRVEGDEIVIRVPKTGSLEEHLANVNERIAAANRGFAGA